MPKDLTPKTKKHLMEEIKRVKVESSNICSVGHSGDDSKMLTVEFHCKDKPENTVWAYYPVTAQAFNLMLQAESVGKYFNANIKTHPDVTGFNLSV